MSEEKSIHKGSMIRVKGRCAGLLVHVNLVDSILEK
jgi:hypothetical protein